MILVNSMQEQENTFHLKTGFPADFTKIKKGLSGNRQS